MSLPDRAEVVRLPILDSKSIILDLIRNNRVVIITGSTGTGKSTKLPQFLLDDGYAKKKMIALTQPRRIGAVSIARRVADELGYKLGEEVGYTVRFEDFTSSNTLIRYLTDGCLLRQILTDPLLLRYSVIILDEAHERSLDTDILFGYVKTLLIKREDFKLVITSATLDVEKFETFFSFPSNVNSSLSYHSASYHISGIQYPVEVIYSNNDDNERNVIRLAVETVINIHISKPLGDILVFLTGQAEIESACKLLGKKIDELFQDEVYKNMPNIIILPMYGILLPELQQRIFSPTPKGCRKVVISTNITETSLTVDGIVYVVDAGYVKQNKYNPDTGIDSLVIERISITAAEQRAGRAGRTRPGICYRLYTSELYSTFDQDSLPEMQRSNISNTLQFHTLKDPPDEEQLYNALHTLWLIKAIDDEGKISELGKAAVNFPLDPRLSYMILRSSRFRCVKSICKIVAMLTVENLFFPFALLKPEHLDNLRDLFFPFSDHISYLFIYTQWEENIHNKRSFIQCINLTYYLGWCQEHGLQQRALFKAEKIYLQLIDIASKLSHDKIRDEDISTYHINRILQIIGETFYPTSAYLFGNGIYRRLIDSTFVHIHPTSVLFNGEYPKFIVSSQMIISNKTYMQNVSAVEFGWIKPLINRISSSPYILLMKREESIQEQKSTVDFEDYSKEEFEAKKLAARERYFERKRKREEEKR